MRPRRDLNPVEISKSLEFFCPNMAGCCPIRLKLDTGVQFRYEAVRLRKFGILIASAAPSRLNLLLPCPPNCTLATWRQHLPVKSHICASRSPTVSASLRVFQAMNTRRSSQAAARVGERVAAVSLRARLVIRAAPTSLQCPALNPESTGTPATR